MPASKKTGATVSHGQQGLVVDSAIVFEIEEMGVVQREKLFYADIIADRLSG